MLSADTLFTELQRFCDPPAAVFTGRPTGRVQARRRWARAFGVYAGGIIDLASTGGALAALLPQSGAVPGTLRVGFAAAIEAAFFDEIELENGLSARVAAEDFADAWRTGVRAVQAGAGARLPAATPIFNWSAWSPTAPPRDLVDDRRDALADALERLFRAPTIATRTRLREIANAFHDATFELTAVGGAGTITYR